MPDVSHDDAGEWLSFAELGQRRGISKASAERLVRRRRWRRQAANDGTVRVYVPTGALEAADRPHDDRPDVRSFDAALVAIREAHAGEVAALHETIAELRTDRETVRKQLAEVQAAAKQARYEADLLAKRVNQISEEEARRKAMGRWARLKAAWRGE